MFFSAQKRQISTIGVALIFSFYTASAGATPLAPTIRAPENSPSVPRQTVQAPANTTGTTHSVPISGTPSPVQPAVQSGQTMRTEPAGTAQSKREPVILNTSASTSPQPSQTINTPVVPGHPFRIQNKVENYNSLLSKTATRKLDSALANMIGGYGEKVPGLGVIVFKNGKEVYRNMMGNRFLSPRNKNWNLPVTSESYFRVASISKIFTAAGYLHLAEQGKISLDEDVSRYLGFRLRNPHYPNSVITSRMLLSHTSSIRDYPTSYVPFKSNVGSFFTSEDCWTRGRTPGTYFSYSNLNFVLLATIMEKVSGQRFDKYITRNVLKPLDIKGSFNLRDFSSSDLQKMGTLYRKTNGEAGRYYAQIDDRPIELPDARRLANYRPGTNAGIFSPQGGLRISPEGLSHMLQMMMNRGKYQGKQVLQPETVQLMEKQVWKFNPARPNGDIDNDAIESYGLALQYFSGTGSTRPVPGRPDFDLIGHLGEAYGFIGGLMWQPGTQNGFVFLQNGFATGYKLNKGRYSRNYRWEENFMRAIVENVFAK